MKKLFFLYTILFISLSFSFAENFRVRKTVVIDMTDELNTVKAKIGANDALAIKLPKQSPFLNGFSFEIKIPSDIAEYHGSVAYSLYGQISPKPSSKIIDYSGNRLCIDTFPGRLSTNLLIPLSEYVEFKETPYSIVLPAAAMNSEYIFFRMQVVMKGTPLSIWSSELDFEIQPILSNKGILNLSIVEPDLENSPTLLTKKQIKGNPYSIFIDGKIPEYQNNNLILNVGEHHLSIVSDIYRNEVRTINIEQAQSTNLSVYLRDIIPEIEIVAPEATQVFLDSIELQEWDKPIPIEEGNHLLRFVVGGYEKVQSFEAFNGKNYKFNIYLDVQMQEE